MEYIFIYGTGKYGRLLHGFIKSINGTIDGFIDTYANDGDECEGSPVYNLAGFKNSFNPSNVRIIIGIKDNKGCEEIRFNLYKIGISNRQIISGTEFIESNDISNTKKYCLICGQYVDDFYPEGIKGEVFEKNHIIGGGYNSKCKCQICNSLDRYRWIYYVLRIHTDIFDRPLKILWFAPERQILDKVLCANPETSIYTADIARGGARYQVDMTNIQFDDNTFDYVIANHVLEHITDEESAVRELRRVVKKTGQIILSFPIASNIETTIEDSSIVSNEDRLKVYGQEDHVRLYGSDYKKRLEAYGLNIATFSPNMELKEKEIEEYGLIPDDVIMVCKKA